VKKLRESWDNNRDGVYRTADQLTEITKKQLEGSAPAVTGPVPASWMAEAIETLEETFDPDFGGFGYDKNNPQRPKFPEPSNLLFLATWIREHGAAKPELAATAKKMLFSSCEKMSLGGMYDHLGGGFHRYSVDRYWAIPHFEKMLYDNGQLAAVYSAAYEIDPKPELKRTVEGILEFVQTEMTSPEGGFYSALDAESDGEEGKYYRWTKEEIESLLSGEELELFSKHYRINEAPNFEGKYYAPQLKETLDGETFSKLDAARKKLLEFRSKRERPLLDNKILASWNGMMIRGFADAGRVFKNEKYIDVAKKAAKFALENLADDQGRLKRTSTGGVAKLNGYLADYACVIDGLLAIHKATGEKEWIDAAKKIQTKQDELFEDPKSGGYFYTSADHEVLLIRSKRVADSERPSGSSVAAANLLYLAKVTGDKQYAERAKKTALSASGLLDSSSSHESW